MATHMFMTSDGRFIILPKSWLISPILISFNLQFLYNIIKTMEFVLRTRAIISIIVREIMTGLL